MTKNQLLHTEKTTEFIKAIKSMGYEYNRSNGSHAIYECQGKPSLTIVDGGHKIISIGVRRQNCNKLAPYLDKD
jgi:predicted RNA binding protein YcfA (HicA-like mRNA interferase family)